MERVYKREGILFKILPCLLIAMYAVMCLLGSYVCAADNEDIKTVYCEVLDHNFELKYNIFNNNNIKYMLITSNQSYNKDTLVKFHFIIYDGIAYYDENNQVFHFKNSHVYSFNSVTFSQNFTKEKSIVSFSQALDRNFSSFEDFSGDIHNDLKVEENYTSGSIIDKIYCSSSNNVYNYSDESKVVFQGASQEALATIIRPQVEGIQLQEILQEIIQILPLTIAVVVSFLGLRKALSWLLTRLRQS